MSNKNLTIKLKAKQDSGKRTYYVGKLQFPGNIDCSDGVTFLVFVSDQDDEELQLMPMDSKNKNNYDD